MLFNLVFTVAQLVGSNGAGVRFVVAVAQTLRVRAEGQCRDVPAFMQQTSLAARIFVIVVTKICQFVVVVFVSVSRRALVAMKAWH